MGNSPDGRAIDAAGNARGVVAVLRQPATSHTVDTSDLMRRMVKEKLVTMEGKPLFPERFAYKLKFELSDDEAALYEEVTNYVREEFNRADNLDKSRRGTVGLRTNAISS